MKLLILLLFVGCSRVDLNQTMSMIDKSREPSNKEMVLGTKDALKVGFTRAVSKLNKEGGFLNDASIKIPIPKEIKGITSTLNNLGFKSVETKLEKLINNSAERASGEARDIFVEAIVSLSVSDVLDILMGEKDAATQFLKEKTQSKLKDKFRPIIYGALNKQGALDYYSKITKTYNSVPFVDRVNEDPTAYVTEKALSGVFKSIAKEEALIRDNPLKRSTELLKKVFSYVDSKRKE